MKLLSKLYSYQKSEVTIVSAKFNWIFTFFSTWIVWGYYLDLKSHTKSRVLDESFLNPWHIFVYLGVIGFILFFIYSLRISPTTRNHLPKGYNLSFIGILLLGLSGFLDMLWHTFIGVEKGLELFASPPHILMSIASFLIVSGPFRNYATVKIKKISTFSILPAVISLSYILSCFTFMTLHTHPFFQVYAGGYYWRDAFQNQDRAIYFIIIQSALLAGTIFSCLRLGKLPFGSFTLILAINALLMCMLRDNYKFIPGVVLSGLVTDLLYHKLKVAQLYSLHIFGFLTTFIYSSSYFLTLIISRSLIWPAHLWMGTILLSGITGLLISYLVTQYSERESSR